VRPRPQVGGIPAPAHSEIVSMTRRVRQLLGTLDEVVWATDPANDSLSNVIAFLCDYTEGFLSPTAIRSRLEAPAASDLPDVTLTAQTRHNLLLAAKEALNNSVRHAQAQTIWLKIRIGTGQLTVEIVDDGRGFDPGKGARGRQRSLEYQEPHGADPWARRNPKPARPWDNRSAHDTNGSGVAVENAQADTTL